MSYAYPTVTLDNGIAYTVYSDQDDADNYNAASMTADSYNGLDDNTRARTLISAARWLDGLPWLGAKADSGQDHAWPRSGISGVDSGSIPGPIVTASFELAAGLADDPTLFTSLNDPQAYMVKAGSVSVTYFRGIEVQWLGIVPKAALILIQPYLGMVNSAGGPTISGTDGTDSGDTVVDQDWNFYHGV